MSLKVNLALFEEIICFSTVILDILFRDRLLFVKQSQEAKETEGFSTGPGTSSFRS